MAKGTACFDYGKVKPVKRSVIAATWTRRNTHKRLEASLDKKFGVVPRTKK